MGYAFGTRRAVGNRRPAIIHGKIRLVSLVISEFSSISRRFVGALLGSVFLSCCSPLATSSALPISSANTQAALEHLYVADAFGNDVTVYDAANGKIARRISDNVSLPTSLAVDASGNLFVGGRYITKYRPGSGTASMTISQGVANPVALALDSSGELYAANPATIIGSYCACGNVVVYSASTGALLRTMKSYGPTALTFDGSGNLYVANFVNNTIAIYHTGEKRPFTLIKNGVAAPLALAFGPDGDLYVANVQSLTVYSGRSHLLKRTITSGVKNPRALAFDDEGNLYVANTGGANTVTVYAPGQASVLRTISQGVNTPQELVFGSGGRLYVANGVGGKKLGTISVYDRGSGTPRRIIAEGIDEPKALLTGP